LKTRYSLQKVSGKLVIPYQEYNKGTAEKVMDFAEYILSKIKEFLKKKFLLDDI